MQIHSKLTGTKGFVSGWEEAVRFRDMITQEAQERVRILAFWHAHGLDAAKDAFTVSKATLYRWQDALDEAEGSLEALNPGSTAPKTRRTRVIPGPVLNLIIAERKREKIGKDKLAALIKEDGVGTQSASTVGRMLHDLKKQGKLPDPKRFSMSGRTGNLIERKPKQYKKKLRSKGHTGGLVKADTVVRFTNGIKRYILTAIDCENKFAFAYGYASHGSQNAADFMDAFKRVAPVSLTYVQTDNGSEFANHFEAYCDEAGIVHFSAYPRTPTMQAEIERFNRTLSEAFISRNRHLLAYDLPRFNRALMDWLLWYNARRPHWSIGLIPPLRYIVNKLPAAESQMCWTSTGT